MVDMEALAAYAFEGLETEVEELTQRFLETERGYSTYMERTRRQLGELRTLDAKIKAVQAVIGSGSVEGTRLVADISALEAHPRVVDLSLVDDKLIITTTSDIMITRPDTEETRWLGAFEISIGMRNNSVRIENLDTRRHGRDHPHISGGVPCFGNHDSDFNEVLRSRDYLMFFELIVQYLETLNLQDSWGSYGAYWFDLPDTAPTDEVEVPEPAAPLHEAGDEEYSARIEGALAAGYTATLHNYMPLPTTGRLAALLNNDPDDRLDRD